jgi:hypothetical protein
LTELPVSLKGSRLSGQRAANRLASLRFLRLLDLWATCRVNIGVRLTPAEGDHCYNLVTTAEEALPVVGLKPVAMPQLNAPFEPVQCARRAEPRTFTVINRSAQVRIGFCRDGIARGLPFTDAVATQAGTLGQVFARQPPQHARSMELQT